MLGQCFLHTGFLNLFEIYPCYFLSKNRSSYFKFLHIYCWFWRKGKRRKLTTKFSCDTFYGISSLYMIYSKYPLVLHYICAQYTCVAYSFWNLTVEKYGSSPVWEEESATSVQETVACKLTAGKWIGDSTQPSHLGDSALTGMHSVLNFLYDSLKDTRLDACH
jgi:hypothetical protein